MDKTELEIMNVNIIGVRISNLDLKELLDCIHEKIQNKRNSLMLSGNVYSINTAHQLPWYKELMNSADIVRNDSAGVQIAGKLLGTPIKSRLTWADFGWDLAEFCEREGLTQFFLGNKQGVAEKAKTKLQEKHPNLQVVGTHHGYFDKKGTENDEVIRKVNSLKPDILIIGFGMPLQEQWIVNNREKLDVGIIMTGGNCFTFLAGEESRAPHWMHKNGLEWLYRLAKEPKRMFYRYVIGNPLFLFRVLLEKFGKKY